MLLFFGQRSKRIIGRVFEGIKCPNCGNKSFATYGILNYFHIYWIPMFPMSRVAGIICTHCKGDYSGKQLPKDFSKIIKENVFRKRNTLLSFSGTIIITALVFYFGIFSALAQFHSEVSKIEYSANENFFIIDMAKIDKDYDRRFRYGAVKINQINKLGYPESPSCE